MSFIKSFALAGLLLFLLQGCEISPVKGSFYPEEILGEKIVFYTLNSNVPEGSRRIKKETLYYFHRDGTFSSTLDGDPFEKGTFSYRLIGKTNKAILTLHHESEEGRYNYSISMTYASAYAGNWELDSDSSKIHKEVGSFRFLK